MSQTSSSNAILDTANGALLQSVRVLVVKQFLKGKLLDNVDLGLKRPGQDQRLGFCFFMWEGGKYLVLQASGMPTNEENDRLTDEVAMLLGLKHLVVGNRTYKHLLAVVSLT